MSILRPLRAISDTVDSLVRIAVVVSTAAFTLLIFVSVVSRYVANVSILFSVEVSKLLFVWSAFLGATTAYKRHVHIRFEFMSRIIGWKGRLATDVLLYLSALVFFSYILVYGLRFARIVWRTYLPVLALSQGWLYVPVYITAAIFILHSLRLLGDRVVAWNDTEGSE